MSRIPALLFGFWLFGAAVGAAFTEVDWTFWACWAMAWFGLLRMVYARRPEEDDRAHA